MYLVMYGYSGSNKFWVFDDMNSAVYHCMSLAESVGYHFEYAEISTVLLHGNTWNHFPFTVKKCY